MLEIRKNRQGKILLLFAFVKLLYGLRLESFFSKVVEGGGGRWKVLYSMSCAGEVFLSSSQNPRVIRIEERQFRDNGTVIRGKNRLVMRRVLGN